MKFDFVGFFEYMSKLSSLIKPDKDNEYFTWRNIDSGVSLNSVWIYSIFIKIDDYEKKRHKEGHLLLFISSIENSYVLLFK